MSTHNGPAHSWTPPEGRAREEHFPGFRIRTLAALEAAMSQPDKSPALIEAVLNAVTNSWLDADDRMPMLAALLKEPALTQAHLRTMTKNARFTQGWDTNAAICKHRLVDEEMTIWALWNAPLETLQDVSNAIGTLLPAAIWWVRSAMWRNPPVELSLSSPTPAQHARVSDCVARWAAQVAEVADLASFLTTSSFTFTNEDDMFAVGRAICAQPSRSGRFRA